ncbi:MAG: phage tail tube protein [Fusobacteriaceae bacterium]
MIKIAIQVFIGKQTAIKTKATDFYDLRATDFNINENITMLNSEVFQSIQAEGDSVVGKIEVSGSIPFELTEKVLVLLLPALSYKIDSTKKIYKMSNDKPLFYTIILNDTNNNENHEYLDCIVNSLTLKTVMGGYITGDLQITGKKFEVKTGGVTLSTTAEDSLRALTSTVKLENTDITSDVESIEIKIDNGIEAKGALNSLYNEKIRRAKPQSTTVDIEKNEYDKNSFSVLKNKMIAGTPATVELKIGVLGKTIKIEALRTQISKNSRGDYKGSGTHSIGMSCSANGVEASHLKFTFEATQV